MPCGVYSWAVTNRVNRAKVTWTNGINRAAPLHSPRSSSLSGRTRTVRTRQFGCGSWSKLCGSWPKLCGSKPLLMGVGRTTRWPLRVDCPIKCSASLKYSHSHRARHNIIFCRARCRTFGPPCLRHMLIYHASPSCSHMAQFIDYGDNCSDGPPSSIGDYDIHDPFIDNDEISQSPLFEPNPDSPQVSLEGYQSSSSLGIHSVRRRKRLVRPSQVSRVSLPSRHSPYPSSAGGRGRRSPSWISLHSRANSEVQSSSGTDDLPLRSLHALQGLQGVSDARESRSSTPDPFQVPDHLRTGELAGCGVAGKRLGTGKPRFAARYFLFTIAQSGYDWPYERFIERVEAAGAKHHISRERHEDGGYHFHCFVDFERKFDFENIHRFCVGPPQDDPSRKCPTKNHCNILPITKTPFHAWDYAGKYGDVLSSNCERPRARGPNVTRDDLWTGSLAQTDKTQFLKDVSNHSPRDFVLFHSQISNFADSKWNSISAKLPRVEEDGIHIHWERYPEARRWVLENLSDPIPRIKATSRGFSYPPETEAEDARYCVDRLGVRLRRPKSLIVWGPSRLGKTLFGTNLGPHVHWVQTFNLKKLLSIGVENVDYAIFDDISWKDPSLKDEGYKAWLGAQQEFDCTDKYAHKSTLVWGKPCIFLTNNDPYTELTPDQIDWFELNCVVVRLGSRDKDRSNAICSSDAHANS